MAFLFVDGFESFGSTPGAAPVGLINKWVENFSLTHTGDTLQSGRWNGMSCRPRATSGATAGAEINLVTQYTTLICGFAFRVSAMPAILRELVNFSTTSGTEVGVSVLSTGKLRVNRNDPTVAIQDSTLSDLVRPNRWYYLEFKALVANSGTFDVYLDGVQVAFSSNSGDTQTTNAFATIVRLCGRSSTGNNVNVDVDYDDCYILDTSATPNDFLGPRHMYTVFPDGAGDDTDLTPNTGSNFQAVDDDGHDTDTTYVATTTDLAQDLYTFGAVSGASDIDVVAVYCLARKTDTTSFNVLCLAKSSSTEDAGASLLVNTTTYNAFGGFFLEDPDTTDPWDQSGINAAQFGLKVEA